MQQHEDAFNTSSEGTQRQRHPRGVHRVKGKSHTLMKIVLGCSSIGRGEGEQTSSDMLQTASCTFMRTSLGQRTTQKKSLRRKTDLEINRVIAHDETNVQLRAVRGKVLRHPVGLQDVDAVARVPRAQENGHIELGDRGGKQGGGEGSRERTLHTQWSVCC